MSEDGFDFEVDADGADERWREGVVGITEQEGGLADAAVADDKQFEHVVEVLVSRILLPLGLLTSSHLQHREHTGVRESIYCIVLWWGKGLGGYETWLDQ